MTVATAPVSVQELVMTVRVGEILNRWSVRSGSTATSALMFYAAVLMQVFRFSDKDSGFVAVPS